MTRPRLRKMLQISLILAGVLILLWMYAALWRTQITTPRIRQSADFLAFYTAGEIAEKDGIQDVYDREKQLAVQENVQRRALVADELLSYNHLPYLIPLLDVLFDENYVASFTRWGLFLLMLHLVSTVILSKILAVEKSGEKRLLFIGVLLFYPTFLSILKGQDSVIMLLGVSIWALAFQQKKDTLAGVGLALTTVRPHIALFLAIPFLLKRRKIFWSFAISSSILALWSVALIGHEGTRQFIELITISSQGEGYNLKPEAMLNLVGILARRFSSISSSSLENIAWVFFGSGILGSVLLWWQSKKITSAHLGLAVLLSVLTAPHLHYHDLAITIIPLLLGIRIAMRRISLEKLLPIPLGLAFILMANQYLPQIYIIPYLALFGGIFFFSKEIAMTHQKTA